MAKSQASYNKCEKLTMTAWSLQLDGKVEATQATCTALGVILCTASLDCLAVQLISPFVIALEGDLPDCVEVQSLVLLSKIASPTGLSYLHLCFEESIHSAKITTSQSDSWKMTADMMKDRFSSATVDVEEMLLGTFLSSTFVITLGSRIEIHKRS